MPILNLGGRFIMIDDHQKGDGWGVPSWAKNKALAWGGASGKQLWGQSLKPEPVGARYFCGDDYPQSVAQEEPIAMGNNYTGTRLAYQESIDQHYEDNHPDLKYPVENTDDSTEAVAAKKGRRDAAKARRVA